MWCILEANKNKLMKTIFRKIKIKERLPCKSGNYIFSTITGNAITCFWDFEEKTVTVDTFLDTITQDTWFIDKTNFYHWLEEVELPEDEFCIDCYGK